MNKMALVLPLLIGCALAQAQGSSAQATRPPLVTCEATKTAPCVVLATSIPDMAGVWKHYQSNPIFAPASGMGYIRYSADGTFALADTQEHAALPSFGPFPHGTYSFEGSRMTINVANPPPSMPECAHSVQEVRVVKMGAQMVAMTVTPIEDTCTPRLRESQQMQVYIGPAQ